MKNAVMKRIYIIIFFLIGFAWSRAQIFGIDLGIKQDSIANSESIHDFDFNDTINLKPSEIYSLNLKTDLEKKYYFWLRQRVRDVWPYVRVAVREYDYVTDSITKLDRGRDKRQFIKKQQKALADKFEHKLKNLTTSRGQILTKLIYRETDQTAFDIIKNLRGGVNAFIWNTAGGAYNVSLKQTYNPKKTREDYFIEAILQRDFASGMLIPVYEDDEN